MSPLLLATSLLIGFSVAIAVGVYLGQVFASTLNKRWKGSIETDITSLNLELERVRNLLKSLSNRQALADYKANKGEKAAAEPEKLTRDQLRAKYLKGSHIEIARRAMSGGE